MMQQEFSVLIYEPLEGEWPDWGRDRECDRISHGLESIMELSIAEHFLAPVDLNAFPAYAMVIEYLIDLSTIKARLENRYYRYVHVVCHLSMRLTIAANSTEWGRAQAVEHLPVKVWITRSILHSSYIAVFFRLCSVPKSGSQLVHQRLWYVPSCP